MRKGRDGEKKKTGKKKKKGKKTGKKKEKTDDYSGHYVIASSRPSECRPLERRTLVPIILVCLLSNNGQIITTTIPNLSEQK